MDHDPVTTIADADITRTIEAELWGCKTRDVTIIAQRIIDALHRQGYRVIHDGERELQQ